MHLGETRTRRRIDQVLRHEHDIDPNAPCVHREHQDGNYCGGPLAAQYDRPRPIQDGDQDGLHDQEPPVIVLCLHHSNLWEQHRYRDMFIRDVEPRYVRGRSTGGHASGSGKAHLFAPEQAAGGLHKALTPDGHLDPDEDTRRRPRRP